MRDAPLYLDLLMVVGQKIFPKWWFNGDLLWSKVKNHRKQKCMNKSQIKDALKELLSAVEYAIIWGCF